jgi:hypothetical protein
MVINRPLAKIDAGDVNSGIEKIVKLKVKNIWAYY